MEEWVQATQEAYKGFIERPPMEQKHLSRPPFMFIIQIFFEVMTKTGFGKGLYEPVEFTKDYFTDPQKKVFVLKKLIHLVRMVEGKFEILPENIVRGTDCDKTNVFLQKLAKAAKSGTNTDELVSKILDKASKGGAGGAGDTQELASAPGSKLQAPEAKTQHMLSGHQRDVADLTKEAKIAANEPEAGEAGGIRMGSLNRAGKRQDSRVLAGPSASIGEKAPAEAADQAVTSIATLKEAIQKAQRLGSSSSIGEDDGEQLGNTCVPFFDIEYSSILAEATGQTGKGYRATFAKINQHLPLFKDIFGLQCVDKSISELRNQSFVPLGSSS